MTSVATDTSSTYDTYRFKVEFAYDGQGRVRLRRDYTWVGGMWYQNTETRHLYDGLLLVQERDGGNTPTVTYTRGRDLSGSRERAGGIGGLLARSHGYSAGNWSSHNCYHADGNGNVTALVNSSGVLQASYKYDPYGRYLSGGGTLASANVMRFSSKPWVGFAGSTTTGLYYYGYRFYDPYLQRWVNRDPIAEEGGRNLYGFTQNSPFSRTDSFGLTDGYVPASEKKAKPGKKPAPEPSDKAKEALELVNQLGECWKQWCEDRLPTSGSVGKGLGTSAGVFVDTALKCTEVGPGLTAIGIWSTFNNACLDCSSQFYNDDEAGRRQETTCEFICAMALQMSIRIGKVAGAL